MDSTGDMSGVLSATIPPAGAEDQPEDSGLSVYDAYRFRAITEEAVERLDLLGLVTMESGRRRDQNSADKQAGNRKDVHRLMINQKELEEKYEMLMQKRSQLRGLQNKSKYLQNQAELKEVASQLRESTGTIVQNLKDHPAVVSNIQKIQKDRAELQGLLEDTTEGLKASSFKVLVQQVNVRMERQRLLWETQLAHQKTREALKNLETELAGERDGFERHMEERNAEIHALTAELKHLKKVTALSLKYEKETAEGRQETVNRMNKRQLNKVRQEIKGLKDSAARDQLVHTDTVDFLSKQKLQLDQLHDDWEHKYKTDYGKLNHELEALTTDRDKDLEVLTNVQHRWEVDKAEKSAKAEEKKQRAIEEENKRKLIKIMNLAQAKIYFLWRVYNRKRPKKKKRKKKASKKK